MESEDRFWLSWSEIEQLCVDRPTLLYGRSEDWVHKAIRQLRNPPQGIIDHDLGYAGTTYRGLNVMPIEEVEDPRKHFFIITAGFFHGIVEVLESLGLKPGLDFACSPDFKDFSELLELRNLASTVLISSSDYRDTVRARSSEAGGGLYLLNLEDGDLSCVYSGSTRQIIRIPEDRLAAVDYVSKELLFFDSSFSITKRIDVGHPNACGITFSEDLGFLYVLNAGRDTLAIYDLESCSFVEELPIGRSTTSEGLHHFNDVTIYEGTLFLSYFSWSGYFKQGVFDGGVAAWDLTVPKPSLTPLISQLWKPHSPVVIRGDLHVLDSMNGFLRTGRPEPKARLSAFLRGLDYKNGVMTIGQSEQMYITERLGSEAGTVTANAGVHIMKYDESFIKMARFVSTPSLMNIHDLLIWDA